MDFNQKQTAVNLGLSYTNSAISANLDSAGDNFFQWSPQYNKRIIYNPKTDLNTLKCNRQDWATHVDLTQVINKNTVLNLGMGYTRSTGFLENPYKLSWFFGIDQVNGNHPYLNEGYYSAVGQPFIEQRHDNRNQWNWSARWANYIEPLDAAVHLGYSY